MEVSFVQIIVPNSIKEISLEV